LRSVFVISEMFVQACGGAGFAIGWKGMHFAKMIRPRLQNIHNLIFYNFPDNFKSHDIAFH